MTQSAMTFPELLLRNGECANLASSGDPGASRDLSWNSAGEAQEDEPVEAAPDATVV